MVFGEIDEVQGLDVLKFPLQITHQDVLVRVVLLQLDLHRVELVLVLIGTHLAWFGFLQVLELLVQSVKLCDHRVHAVLPSRDVRTDVAVVESALHISQLFVAGMDVCENVGYVVFLGVQVV